MVSRVKTGKLSFIAYASYSLKDLARAFEELVQNNYPYNIILLMTTF